MQIGIDLGASKIESVILDEQGNEKHRQRVDCPKNYNSIIEEIKKIVFEIESKTQKTLPLGVCHPGVHSPQSGLVKNAPNCIWIEKKPFQKDLREALGREVFCENDANCFALSEAIDGAGKHYKIVYGIILGSGAGGGLVIDKQIVNGPNGIAGEWGHNQLPYMAAKKENLNTTSMRESEIESFISGMGLAKKYNKRYKDNPYFQSRLIWTTLNILVIFHIKNDLKYSQLYSFDKYRFPRFIDKIFNQILYQTQFEVKNALIIKNYILRFNQPLSPKSRISFTEVCKYNGRYSTPQYSFDIMFAQNDSAMTEWLQKIQNKYDIEKQRKEEEIERTKDKYHQQLNIRF